MLQFTPTPPVRTPQAPAVSPEEFFDAYFEQAAPAELEGTIDAALLTAAAPTLAEIHTAQGES